MIPKVVISMADKGAQNGFDEVFGAAKKQKSQEYIPCFPVDFSAFPIYQVGIEPIYKWVDHKPTDTVETNELGHAKAWRIFSVGEPNGKQCFRFVAEFKTPDDVASAMELNGKQVEFIDPMVAPKTRLKPSKSGFVSTVYEWLFKCHGVKEYDAPDAVLYDKDGKEIRDKGNAK